MTGSAGHAGIPREQPEGTAQADARGTPCPDAARPAGAAAAHEPGQGRPVPGTGQAGTGRTMQARGKPEAGRPAGGGAPSRLTAPAAARRGA